MTTRRDSLGAEAHLFVCSKNESTVSATKAKRIRNNGFDHSIARLVGHVVQIARRILVIEVRRWRRNLILNGLNGENSLRNTGGTEQMPCRRLCRADKKFVGDIAECPAYAYGFTDVSCRC